MIYIKTAGRKNRPAVSIFSSLSVDKTYGELPGIFGRISPVGSEYASGGTSHSAGAVIEIEGDGIRLLQLILVNRFGKILSIIVIGIEVEKVSGRDAYAGSNVLLFSFIGLFQLFSDFHQGKTEDVVAGPVGNIKTLIVVQANTTGPDLV